MFLTENIGISRENDIDPVAGSASRKLLPDWVYTIN